MNWCYNPRVVHRFNHHNKAKQIILALPFRGCQRKWICMFSLALEALSDNLVWVWGPAQGRHARVPPALPPRLHSGSDLIRIELLPAVSRWTDITNYSFTFYSACLIIAFKVTLSSSGVTDLYGTESYLMAPELYEGLPVC